MVILLSNFDKNKEWADLSNWLIKVEKTLQEVGRDGRDACDPFPHATNTFFYFFFYF